MHGQLFSSATRRTTRRAKASLFLLGCLLAGAAQSAPVELLVEPLIPTYVDVNNNFAETTRFSVRAVYPSDHRFAGQVVHDLDAKLEIAEWRTDIYDGEYGATRLPMTVPLRRGTAEFTLRSLARYTVSDQDRSPVVELSISSGEADTRVNVQQWIDADADGEIDWLSLQINHLLEKGRNSEVAVVREVLQSVDEWRQSNLRDCGGVLPEAPTIVGVGASCLDAQGVNIHRTNLNGELAATLLHEARHVWAYRNPERSGLPRVYSVSRDALAACRTGGAADCESQRELDLEAVQIHERDAENFAQRYKKYLQ